MFSLRMLAACSPPCTSPESAYTPDVRLHPEVPVVALLGLAISVASTVPVRSSSPLACKMSLTPAKAMLIKSPTGTSNALT